MFYSKNLTPYVDPLSLLYFQWGLVAILRPCETLASSRFSPAPTGVYTEHRERGSWRWQFPRKHRPGRPTAIARPLHEGQGGAVVRITSPPPPDGAFPSPNGRGELPWANAGSAVLHAPLRIGEGQPRGARRGEVTRPAFDLSRPSRNSILCTA